ncbi:hypothetical protein D3C83_116210 [compost metagenome]
MGVNRRTFSSALALVSGLIQARFSMRTFSASLMFLISASIRALDSAGNATWT